MKILLVGESSLLHNTLKKGLVELGHQVTLMSDGNDWHNSPRDIDLRRNMERYGRWSGLMVLWKIVCNLHKICGNDIVQVHNYQFVPLMGWWNMLIFWFLKLTNKRIIKGCFADDPHLFRQQAKGIPAYSDTFWNGKLQNIEENKERMAFHFMPQFDKCWHTVSYHSDALIACLYEYYLCYDVSEFHKKLYYIPLPMIIPAIDENRQKGNGEVIKVLVGLQPKREYLKGALKIAHFVEILAKKYPGKIELKYVEGVVYDEYCRMLDEADVLVDQFYSYTPSMNSLAAMARGTVVIGGGEEEYYEFIGEPELRPIINVSPEYSESQNVAIIEQAFFVKDNLTEFVQIIIVQSLGKTFMQGITFGLVFQHTTVGTAELSLIESLTKTLGSFGHFFVYLVIVLSKLVLYQHIGTITFLGIAVVNQRVIESIYVSAGFPDGGVHKDC